MAIRSEIIVTDNGSAVFERHAGVADKALADIGKGVERASTKFDAFSTKASNSLNSISDPLRSVGDKYNIFSVRANNALSKVERGMGMLSSEVNEASDKTNAALKKVEDGFRSTEISTDEAIRLIDQHLLRMQMSTANQAAKVRRSLIMIDDGVQKNVESFNRYRSLLGRVVGSFFNLRNAIIGAGLGILGKEVFDAGTELNAMRQAMNAAAGSSEEGARQFEFAQSTAERLGLSLGVATKSYKGILAATVASNREISEGQEIFLSIAEAGRVMQLSNDDLAGSLRAIQQILQKGRVFAEEWNQQLGDRFPVAAGIMARSLGVATEDLAGLIEQGQVGIDELLTFARAMRSEFADNISDAAKVAAADITRLRNEAQLAAEQFGNAGFFSGIQKIAQAIREVLQQARQTGAIEKLGSTFDDLSTRLAIFIREDGPGMIEQLDKIANSMKENLVPAVQAMGLTINQVFASAMISFAAMQRGVSDIGGTFREFQLGRLELERAFANISGTEEDKARLDAAIKNTKNLIDENIQLGISADKTREKYSQLLNEMVAGLDEAPGKVKGLKTAQELLNKEVGFTADQVKKFSDNMTVAGGQVQIVGKNSKTAIEDGIKDPLAEGGEKAEALARAVDKIKSAASEAGQASKNAINDGVTKPVDEAVDKVKELDKAYKTLGEDSLVKFREETKKSAEAFVTILDSGKESASRITTLFEDLAEDIIDAHGEIPPEFQSIFDRVEKITGKTFEQVGNQIKIVDGAYDRLGAVSLVKLQESARKAAGAFLEIKDTGTESSKRLAALFAPVAQKIIEAFGKVPPEFQSIFSEMEGIAGRSFSTIEEDSKNAADSINNDLSNTLSNAQALQRQLQQNAATSGSGGGGGASGLGGSGGGSGSDSGGLGGRGRNAAENDAAMSETSRSVDAFAAAFAGSSFQFGESVEELTKQLQEQRRRLNDPLTALGAQITGVTGNIEAFRERQGALVDAIEERLAAMRAGREADRLAQIEASRPEPGASLSFISGSTGISGGSSERITATPSSFGGGATGGATNETINIGSGSQAIDPEIDKTADEIISSGNSGILINPALTRSSNQTGGRNVVIENPQFVVDIKGVDASSIDGEGVARALAPALQETIRLGEVEVDDDARVQTR